MKSKENNHAYYCKKCGNKLKRQKTGIMMRTEIQRIDDPYDGGYKELVFRYCECLAKK